MAKIILRNRKEYQRWYRNKNREHLKEYKRLWALRNKKNRKRCKGCSLIIYKKGLYCKVCIDIGLSTPIVFTRERQDGTLKK